MLQDTSAVLAPTAPGRLISLRIQLDLRQNADQEFVHVMGQTRRGLDEFTAAVVRQTATDCRQKWLENVHAIEIFTDSSMCFFPLYRILILQNFIIKIC